MKYYRFPDNRITKILLALYLFLLLYLCRDSMFCLYVVGFYPSMAVILAATLLLGLAFLWYQRGNWKAVFSDGRIKLAVILALAVLAPMLIKRDWQFMYVSILLCLLTAVLLSYAISWRELAKYYVLILTALAVYSILAAYLFRLPIDMGLVEKDVFRNASGIGIYNFLLSVVPRSYATNRNFGLFREPGVYQYFLLLALVLAQYGVRWKKERNMWVATAILSLTMLSTLATGGILELGLLAVFVFFDKKLYRNRALLTIVLVVLVLSSAYLYYSYRTYNALWYQIDLNILYKFYGREDSFLERTEAIAVNLEFFRSHPLWGAELAEVLHAVENNTSSSMILFAAYGLIFGAVHVLAWGCLLWRKNKNILSNLCLLVIVFASFNTQNLTGNQFFWLFPIMALAETVVPRMEKKP